jgi:phosphoribosyl-AMP cyclohydrolase
MDITEELKYDNYGLIPAIVQDYQNNEILMMAYMNKQSLQMTIESGYTHFWSRSRKKFWKKGETSGHVQIVKEILIDCDKDTLLIKVEQLGPGACHTGHRTCFYTNIQSKEVSEKIFSDELVYKEPILARLEKVIIDRKQQRKEGSYVSELMDKGTDFIARKLGEEAIETIVCTIKKE